MPRSVQRQEVCMQEVRMRFLGWAQNAARFSNHALHAIEKADFVGLLQRHLDFALL